MFPRIAAYVGEKYAHGVLVGLGIITANGIWRGFKSICLAVSETDWRSVRGRVQADQVVFWRKS